MKNISKLTILFVLIFIFGIKGESQTCTGFTGGLNFSQFTGLPKYDIHEFEKKIPRKGIYGGILWDIGVAFETSIETGAFYSQQGSIYENEYYNFNEKIRYRLYQKADYIIVPLSWKQTWGDLYTKAGIYGAFALPTSEAYFEEIIETKTELLTGEPKDSNLVYSFVENLKSYDIGANFGMGLIYPISDQFDMFFEANYKMGFFPVEITYEPKMVKKNWMFTISTGFILRGKDKRYATRKRR